MVYVLRYGAAIVVAKISEGLMCLRLSGPITMSTLVALRRDMQLYRHCREIDAILMDWREALVGVSADDLYKLGTGPIKRDSPVAYLVREDSLNLFHEHSWRMTPHDVLRVTFSALPDALAWCAIQVRWARERKALEAASQAPAVARTGS